MFRIFPVLRNSRRRQASAASSFRPGVEYLEDRVVLTSSLPSYGSILGQLTRGEAGLEQALLAQVPAVLNTPLPVFQQGLVDATRLTAQMRTDFDRSAAALATAAGQTRDQVVSSLTGIGFQVVTLDPLAADGNLLHVTYDKALPLSSTSFSLSPTLDLGTMVKATVSGSVTTGTPTLNIHLDLGVDMTALTAAAPSVAAPNFYVLDDSNLALAGLSISGQAAGSFTIGSLTTVNGTATIGASWSAAVTLASPAQGHKLRLADLSAAVRGDINGSVHLNNLAFTANVPGIGPLGLTGSWGADLVHNKLVLETPQIHFAGWQTVLDAFNRSASALSSLSDAARYGLNLGLPFLKQSLVDTGQVANQFAQTLGQIKIAAADTKLTATQISNRLTSLQGDLFQVSIDRTMTLPLPSNTFGASGDLDFGVLHVHLGGTLTITNPTLHLHLVMGADIGQVSLGGLTLPVPSFYVVDSSQLWLDGIKITGTANATVDVGSWGSGISASGTVDAGIDTAAIALSSAPSGIRIRAAQLASAAHPLLTAHVYINPLTFTANLPVLGSIAVASSWKYDVLANVPKPLDVSFNTTDLAKVFHHVVDPIISETSQLPFVNEIAGFLGKQIPGLDLSISQVLGISDQVSQYDADTSGIQPLADSMINQTDTGGSLATGGQALIVAWDKVKDWLAGHHIQLQITPDNLGQKIRDILSSDSAHPVDLVTFQWSPELNANFSKEWVPFSVSFLGLVGGDLKIHLNASGHLGLNIEAGLDTNGFYVLPQATGLSFSAGAGVGMSVDATILGFSVADAGGELKFDLKGSVTFVNTDPNDPSKIYLNNLFSKGESVLDHLAVDLHAGLTGHLYLHSVFYNFDRSYDLGNLIDYHRAAGQTIPTTNNDLEPQFNSGANGWTADTLNGDKSNLVSAANPDGSVGLYALTPDGTVVTRQQYEGGDLTGWWNWGLTGCKSLTATHNAAGLVELFAVAGDGQVLRRCQQTKNGDVYWTGWQRLGPNIHARTVTVATASDGRLEVFALGQDGHVYHIWQTSLPHPWKDIGWIFTDNYVVDGSWNSWWYDRGGNMQSIAVGSNGGRLEIFAVGIDNQVYHLWQTAPSGSWSTSWASCGSVPMRYVTVVNDSSGGLLVFAIGLYSEVYCLQDGGLLFGIDFCSSWEDMHMTAVEIHAALNGAGFIEVLAIDPEWRLQHTVEKPAVLDSWNFGIPWSPWAQENKPNKVQLRMIGDTAVFLGDSAAYVAPNLPWWITHPPGSAPILS
jgi:hypothetical protein